LLSNFFLLNEVSKYLEKEISGYKIKEIFTQEKDKLVITLFHPQSIDLKYLEFSCNEKLPYLFFISEFRKSKKNILNLLAGLYEQEILSVNIFNNDRIIKIELTNDLTVLFVFFKSKYNLFVIADGKIIDSFKNKKEYNENSIEDILNRKEAKKKSNVETVKDYYRMYYRYYGDLIYKEIQYICKIKSDEKFTDEIKKNIDSCIELINGKMKNPVCTIYKYKSDYYPSIINLSCFEEFEKHIFPDVNELIRNFIKFYYWKISNEDLRKNVMRKKENELKNIERKYNSLLKQFESTKNYSQYKVYGDIILSNIHLIKKGDESLTIDGDGFPEKIEILLKKDLSPSKNADEYYKKYKNHKNSVELLKEKIKKQKNEFDLINKEIEEIRNNKNLKSLKKMEKEFNKPDESAKFRKFVMSDKYEIWVGKDSASNDLLTTRYSSQNDLWFHVRGASGSHTVLKISDKKNPPDKRIIEKAASVAAYYSKSRNASSVPVAYCEKKYVKKKKGFKEGSVVMEKEKVIFVKPGLPEEII
jgi:predicted ribosome quality control (RQC) complex YloA/Tae2 family protein